MNNIIYKLALKIRPDLHRMNGQQRMSSTADVFTLLYTFPLAVIGLFWLVRVSSWDSMVDHWLVYLIFGIILYLFNRLRFFYITEIRSGGYANADGALDGIAVWAAILLLGPTALWLKVLWDFIAFCRSIYQEGNTQSYWSRARMFSADIAVDLLATLTALAFYRQLGGSIPISDYSFSSTLPALAGIFIQYIGTILIYSGYIIFVLWSLRNVLHIPIKPAISFFFIVLTLPALANPFGVLAAGIYAREGLWEFLFISFGLLLIAFLARRLSQAAEFSRQQSSQLEQLEILGRAILDGPPDASMLPSFLRDHVSLMFPLRAVLIWTEGLTDLLRDPATLELPQEQIWNWLQEKIETTIFMPKDPLPWSAEFARKGPVILCPIQDVESGRLLGGTYVELQSLSNVMDKRSVYRQLPAIKTLNAQIASAIHQSHTYAQTIAMEKTLQELALARSIQASFLPQALPLLPGWQFAATLEPARQVAGDFYDFISLPDSKLGILIADVADKGLGSALYMALSSTLIRTFANEYYTDPGRILKLANQHILRNAKANLFVTVFLGVLDPTSGKMQYANAGHNPPFLFGRKNGIKALNNTGMPLGIDDGTEWGQEEITINPGELLLLYTDGVLDAQNKEGQFIDRKIILSVPQQNIGKSIDEIQQIILEKVHRFVGDAPRFDDITLIILEREDKQA